MSSIDRLLETLGQRIVVLDGAMGTMIQALGPRGRGAVARRALPRSPARRSRAAATCSRSASRRRSRTSTSRSCAPAPTSSRPTRSPRTSIALADYGLETHRPRASTSPAPRSRAAPRTAPRRKTAGRAGSPARSARRRRPPRCRPTSTIRARAPSRSASSSTRSREQARALIDGGVDLLLTETHIDTLNCKAALFAFEELFAQGVRRVPVIASVTIPDRSGRTLSGQTVEAFYNSISHAHLLAVCINCALGADDMRPARRGARAVAGMRGRAATRTPACPTSSAATTTRPSTWRRSSARSRARACSTSSAAAAAPAPSTSPRSARPSRASRRARSPTPPQLHAPVGPRAADDHAGDQLHRDRRAHQRHRLGRVPPPDQGRQVRRGRRGRAPAGRGRRQHPRRLHGRGHARRRRRDASGS